MIGLDRGTLGLFDHEKEWEREAQRTITVLKSILGDIIKDIQHVGSTSITSIKAKPIIDIAVAVDDFDAVLSFEKVLRLRGFYYRPESSKAHRDQLLFACGSYYNETGKSQTHFIHVVHTDSMSWKDYINFRDYLNKTPAVAKAYEDLKMALVATAPPENSREFYLRGKHDFITYTLRKALVDSYLGKTVDIKTDRPIGYVHHKGDRTLTYPINYGYIPGVIGGDGEELDVYLLGVNEPVEEYTCRIIGIVHRENDNEDKLVAAPIGMEFTKDEISSAVHFQEQYYISRIETADTAINET